MDLSVCIVTHQQPEILPRCVRSCLAGIEKAGIESEIVIIDNASTDGSPQRVAALYPQVRIVRNGQSLGFSAANNLGIRSSSGQYVLILNDDAILHEESLVLMLRELDSRPDLGAVGPKLLNPDGSLQTHFTNRRFPRLLHALALILQVADRLERNPRTRSLFSLDRDLECSGETEHLAAACLLVRRQALEAINLFDEGFYYWFEDVDLCYRLKQAGWKITYLSEAQVTHYRSASIGRIAEPRRTKMFFKSQMRYFKKHWSGPKYLFVRLTSALGLFFEMPLVILKMWLRDPGRKEWKAWIKTYLPVVRLLLLEWD